ncbi:MAG: polysaccharide biosynthesis C-terminal domain-containing protein [Dehalococcoidia bacterium]|nr:polysaccharide biosynthesis C-terminal domain-containing protein [Dehalococcoidia bacterium]
MMDELPHASPAPSFVRHVNIVLATYAVEGALAFAQGALVAQALGPSGRGVYAIFVLSAGFAQLVLGLGMGSAAIYFINRRELAVRDVVSAAQVSVLWSIAVTGVLVAVVAPLAGSGAIGGGVPVWLFLFAVPALVESAVLRLILQGMSRFAEMGMATVLHPLVMLALVAAAMAAGSPTPGQVIVFWTIGHVCAAAFALSRIGLRQIDLAQIARPRLGTIRRLARFGLQGESGNALQLLNYRLDQYIVRGFVGLAGVGIYAVGVSMSEGVFLLANAVAIVLVPRLTSADAENAGAITPVACRNTMLMAAAGAAVLAAAAAWVIPPVFGSGFRDSVQALWWLLPGTVALTGSKILTSYIFSRGRPLVNTMITVASLAVTLVALFVLVPAFGVDGAAAASSLAYATHFAVALYAYRRLSGQPVLGAIVPRVSDVRLYTDALRGVLSRLAGRTPLPEASPTPRARG